MRKRINCIQDPLKHSSSKKNMKIGIIGAGVGGLVSIRRAQEHNINCTAFEASETIGGCWVYYENPCPKDIKNLIPISMYTNLRTNLPAHLMEFPDFKFKPKSGRSYPHREEVLDYLHKFAEKFDLLPHIKFHHKVSNVARTNDKWILTVKNLQTKETTKEEFDGVMVCSGHNSVPFQPVINGIDTFPGEIIHSVFYRCNNPYEGKTVLIIGCGASSLDHSREIAKVADKVFISHRRDPLSINVSNIYQKPKIRYLDNDKAYFDDNSSETIDALMFCTGYKYEYPFLDASCQLENKKMIIYPLYKLLFNAHHPSMCLIGLLQKTIIFQLLDLQAQVYLKTFLGRVDLPSKSEMLLEAENQREEKLRAKAIGSHFYYLGSKMKEYFHELYNLGGDPLPSVIFEMYGKNGEIFKNNYDSLRDHQFEVLDDFSFQCYRIQ